MKFIVLSFEIKTKYSANNVNIELNSIIWIFKPWTWSSIDIGSLVHDKMALVKNTKMTKGVKVFYVCLW